MGKGDHAVHEGQAKICLEKTRDKHDEIVVQEKLDGSCVAVALQGGALIPLGRAGYPANTSPYEQHQLFAQWVWGNEERFMRVLREGERIVGEWLAQAHGTMYDMDGLEPFAVFDIMTGSKRLAYRELNDRIGELFEQPYTLHVGGPLSVEKAMMLHHKAHWPCDEIEGVVYRVHRRGEVDFLAKYVRPNKVDGKYLPGISGKPPVWNWRP